MKQEYIEIAYLIAAVLFIIGLKFLSSIRKARAGNLLGSLGMLAAIVATLLDSHVVKWEWIIAGLAAGGIVGVALAQTVKMTAMPQMVALLNGFGGLASMLVSGIEYLDPEGSATPFARVSAALGTLIGSVTFTGSVIAYMKLEGLISGRPILYRGQKPVTLLLFLGCAVLAYMLVESNGVPWIFWSLAAASGVLGILLVVPIGGGDMPVVISLLNSYSGMAACATGFVFTPPNTLLIVTGSLVGASGIILTTIMCKAMNRSIINVCFGGFGAVQSGPASSAAARQGTVKSAGPEEIAMLFDGAGSCIIVPGYGMAVAQAQHVVRELADILGSKGIDVKYAIHPVAGRMPGHMNVLLAEANVPYEQLWEMEKVNPLFAQTDMVLVVGANDIVNPDAKTNNSSPLYGMPILEVDKARTVVFCKRSLATGFAGVDNNLFYDPKTIMLFGDAKDSLAKLVAALKQG